MTEYSLGLTWNLEWLGLGIVGFACGVCWITSFFSLYQPCISLLCLTPNRQNWEGEERRPERWCFHVEVRHRDYDFSEVNKDWVPESYWNSVAAGCIAPSGFFENWKCSRWDRFPVTPNCPAELELMFHRETNLNVLPPKVGIWTLTITPALVRQQLIWAVFWQHSLH